MQKAVSKQRKRRRDWWCSDGWETARSGTLPPSRPPPHHHHHQPHRPRSASLLLHLADHVGRDGRVEVDGVVAETLRCFVTLPAPALEGFAHLNLGSMAVLGVILDPVDIL